MCAPRRWRRHKRKSGQGARSSSAPLRMVKDHKCPHLKPRSSGNVKVSRNGTEMHRTPSRNGTEMHRTPRPAKVANLERKRAKELARERRQRGGWYWLGFANNSRFLGGARGWRGTACGVKNQR
jgi:hypothetical protein